MITFVIGLVVGANVGLVIFALMNIAKQNDNGGRIE